MKNAITHILLILLFSQMTLAAEIKAPKPSREMASAFDQSHAQWTQILQKLVVIRGHASTVKYGILKNDAASLSSYLNALKSVSVAEFSKFTEDEKLAFLINAYNAFTVKLIVDNYPLKSIRDLGSLISSPWKIKFFTFLGNERHLDNIEHGLIRQDAKAIQDIESNIRGILPKFNEPRIHFALVCASIGCPALHNEAFIAERLDTQLEDAASNFIADTSRNRYLPENKKLEISSIFKWYGSDFIEKHGSFEAFLATRITSNLEEQRIIANKKATVKFLEYDWSLNDEK